MTLGKRLLIALLIFWLPLCGQAARLTLPCQHERGHHEAVMSGHEHGMAQAHGEGSHCAQHTDHAGSQPNLACDECGQCDLCSVQAPVAPPFLAVSDFSPHLNPHLGYHATLFIPEQPVRPPLIG